jgi:hypothetical protein
MLMSNMHVWTRVTKTGHIFRNSEKTSRIGPVQIIKPSNIVHCFKISKKIKISKKYVKKTRSNSKVTSEEIFIKPSHWIGKI